MSELARIDFMNEEVRAHARYLQEQLTLNFRQAGIAVSGDTVRGFVCKAMGGTGGHAEIDTLFPLQGRMSDMGAGNAYQLGKYIGRNARTELHKGRKGNKVYSRTAWGTQNTLINNLANKFIEHARVNMKDTLLNG